MTDEHLLETLAQKADRIAEDMGFDPDGPVEQFNYQSGREFGKRLVELWPDSPSLRDRILRHVAREAFAEFQSTFPRSPNPGVAEFQTYFLGPLISKAVVGRGLTVPQLAALAEVTPEHVYRLKRAGLSIIFEEEDPPVISGVNRRFSGLDRRQTHLSLDLKGVTSKKWPEPVAVVQPFLLGILDGARTWMETLEYRVPLEESLNRTLADLFRDPILGDIFDGLVVATQRVTQRLRDSVLVMKAEKDKAQKALDLLVELASHRTEILTIFAQAGAAIVDNPNALLAGGDP